MLGICETSLKGNGDRIIHEDFRLIYSGEEEGRLEIRIVLSPKLKDRVMGIKQES